MVLTADAGLDMAALADELPAALPACRRVIAPGRAAELRAWAQAQIDAIEPQASFARALRAAIPEDGVLIDELTQVGYFARVAYPVYVPGALIGPGYQATLGYGFPTRLGAAAGNPITGDGGFGWTLQELATASRYKLCASDRGRGRAGCLARGGCCASRRRAALAVAPGRCRALFLPELQTATNWLVA